MSKRDDIRLSARLTEELEIVFEHTRWVEAELEPLAGEPVFLTIEPISNRRSVKANAYLWGFVYPLISEVTGDPPEVIHEHMKGMFLSEEHFLCNKNGEIVDSRVITKSSTRLTNMSFAEFVRKIQQWAAEFLHIEFDEAHP